MLKEKNAFRKIKMGKSCSWGTCKNRYPKVKIRFVPFVKPTKNAEQRKRAEQWISLCGRKNFTVDDITYNTYICALHFPNYEDVDMYNFHKNKDLTPYSALLVTQSHPPFKATKANIIQPKSTVTLADLDKTHDMSVQNATKISANYSGPKVVTVEVPHRIEVEKASDLHKKIDFDSVAKSSPLKFKGFSHPSTSTPIKRSRDGVPIEIVKSMDPCPSKFFGGI